MSSTIDPRSVPGEEPAQPAPEKKPYVKPDWLVRYEAEEQDKAENREPYLRELKKIAEALDSISAPLWVFVALYLIWMLRH
jgi:hypothetical protein